MTTLNLNLKSIRSLGELKARVENELRGMDLGLVADKDEAERLFAENGETGYVHTGEIFAETITLNDGRFDYDAKVRIYEHYVDSGSVDYYYSYTIEYL